jgi:hypothetical protein
MQRAAAARRVAPADVEDEDGGGVVGDLDQGEKLVAGTGGREGDGPAGVQADDGAADAGQGSVAWHWFACGLGMIGSLAGG